MIGVVKIHIDKDTCDTSRCGENCEFNSRNNFCYLFKKYIIDNKRCEECIDNENDEIT